MIDIHCHLLPAIDDGSDTPEQSAAVMEKMAADGVRGLILTPHVSAEEIESDPEDPLERRDMATTLLRRVAPGEPRLHFGFEIMLNRGFPALGFLGSRFALAGSRYYLVEFPPNASLRHIADAIDGMVAHGAVPVIAHPERYDVCSEASAAAWRSAGARLQVDATTVTRSTTRARRARALLHAGLVDVMAADNHGDGRSLATGAHYLRSRGAAEQAELLTHVNPEAIVDDRQLLPVPSVASREGLLQRLMRHRRR